MAGYIGNKAVGLNVTTGDILGDVGVGGALTANGGAVFNDGSADVDFRIETNGQSNMLFVDGGANAVGINTAVQVDGSSVMNHPLTIAAASNGNLFALNRGTGGLFNSFMSTTGQVGIAATGSNGRLEFRTGTTVGTSTIRMTVESAGDVTIEDGNLVVGTAGHGIDFAATSDGAGTDSSELLDDYEEGAWTPTYRQGSNNPAAYATQYGYYTKVGGVVHATGYLTVNGLASMSGTLVISGLPYTIQNLTSNFSSVNIGYYENLNLPTANTTVMGYANVNTVDLNLRIGNSTASSGSMTAAQLSANGGMIFSVTYRTA